MATSLLGKSPLIESSNSSSNLPTPRFNSGLIARLAVFSVALLVTLFPIQVADSNRAVQLSNADEFMMLNGYTAMNEVELIDIVKAHDLEVYWSGPIQGAKYTLDISENNRISLRYLTDKQRINDPIDRSRLISTYKVPDAYQAVLLAGQENGTVQITSSQGNPIVYYEKYPNNLYLGFKGKDLQVELYDWRSGKALALATGHDVVRPI